MAKPTTKEELFAALDGMVKQLQANERFAAMIGRANQAVCFSVTDLSADYTLKLAEGQVMGEQGKAPDCVLGVSLNSQVLDDIFSGKRDAESAYMSGSLYLRGSEYTAEGMLRYMRDMVAAYRAANS